MPSVSVTVGGDAGKDAETGRWLPSFYTSDLRLYFGRSMSGAYNLFFLFPDVTIPDGSIITNAYITWKFDKYYGTPPACILKFEDAADPAAVSSTDDGNGRATTTASVSVTGPTSGTTWNSPDISDIIQELIDSYSYASGANMQAFVFGPSGSGAHYSASWDSYVTLTIEYAEGSSASVGLIGYGLCGNSSLVGQVLS